MEIYLNFEDQAAEAMAFYGTVFKTKPSDVMHFSDMPDDPNHPVPEAVKSLIMNASMKLNGTRVMFSDAPVGLAPKLVKGNNISLVIQAKTEAEAQELYDGLSADGEIKMALAPQFWAKLYANFTDKFGIEWQINYGQRVDEID